MAALPPADGLEGLRFGLPVGPPAPAGPDHPGKGGVLKFCALAERTLFMVNADPATAQCIELRTGKDRWDSKRLGAAFWGSLVLADGKLYATDQEGDTYVFAAKLEFKQFSRNRLGEHTNASIAISEGDLFIRTDKHLWCIGTAKK